MNIIATRYKFDSQGARLYHVDKHGKVIDPHSTKVVRDASTRNAPLSSEGSGPSCKWWFDRIIVSESDYPLSPEQIAEVMPDTTETASSSGFGKNAVTLTVGQDGSTETEFAPYFLVWEDEPGSIKTAKAVWISEYDFSKMPDQKISDKVKERLDDCVNEAQKMINEAAKESS